MKFAARLFGLALLGAALLGAPKAGAFTLYFAGGEDTSFTNIGAAWFVNSNTTTLFRTGYARESVAIGNSTLADPPANRIQTPAFAATSGLWVHTEFAVDSSLSETANLQAVIIRSPDGVARLLLRQTGTAGQFKASTRNAAGTIADLATSSANIAAVNTVYSLDIHIVYGCTSGDEFQVWLAGTQVINYTGASLCTDSATSLDQVEFAGFNNDGGAVTFGTYFSEVIIADSDTRGMGLWTLTPQAAGNTQSWTPNTVGNIDPAAINDSNFISTGSANALSEWTTPTSAPSGLWNVLAIVQEARVEASTAGPTTAEWLMRTKDGTDHVTGSFAPATASFGNFNNQIWTTNPQTGVGFVIGDIAAGFNLGIESTP